MNYYGNERGAPVRRRCAAQKKPDGSGHFGELIFTNVEGSPWDYWTRIGTVRRN